MADKFIGKWTCEIPYGELEGFDAFNAALGTDPAVVAQYKAMKSAMEYSRNGDTWTGIVTVNGNAVKTYTFSFNKEMEQEGMDGKTYQITTVNDTNPAIFITIPRTRQ